MYEFHRKPLYVACIRAWPGIIIDHVRATPPIRPLPPLSRGWWS